jgi:hypothetical protein
MDQAKTVEWLQSSGSSLLSVSFLMTCIPLSLQTVGDPVQHRPSSRATTGALDRHSAPCYPLMVRLYFNRWLQTVSLSQEWPSLLLISCQCSNPICSQVALFLSSQPVPVSTLPTNVIPVAVVLFLTIAIVRPMLHPKQSLDSAIAPIPSTSCHRLLQPSHQPPVTGNPRFLLTWTPFKLPKG